jgi:hypothetical protein
MDDTYISQDDRTWRRRASDWLRLKMEGLGHTPENARRQVNTLLGGEGSSLPLGIGLADFTPAGLLFASQEGGLAAGEGAARMRDGDIIGGLLGLGSGALSLAAAPIGKPAKAGAERVAEVARAKRRVGTTGQYVGAPPGVDSPAALGALVKKYNDTMEAGLPGRAFYTDSSADVWARSGHDVPLADQFTQNLALLSRSNNVGGNTSMSVKGHVQGVTGDEIRTGRFPSRDSPPLREMYGSGGANYLGHKREPFAEQLSVSWAPERVGRGVNDMHEAEIIGYPTGNFSSATQHAFADELRARAIERANRNALGGVSDWNTGSAQAAAWTGNKIRRGEVAPGDAAKTYATYMPLHEANATYEAVSSPVTGHLAGLLDAPWEKRLEYTLDPRGSWATSPSGRDIGYTAAKLLPGETSLATGRFRDTANPAHVARPIIGTETLADDTRAMTAGSKRALSAVEAARAYFDGQEAGAWHKIMPARGAGDYTGAYLDFGRQLTRQDMEQVAPLFEKRGYYLASAPHGLTVIGNDSTAMGKALAEEIRQVLKANKKEFGATKAEFGRVESDYIDYADAWKSKAPGSVTAEMLKRLDAAGPTAAALEASPAYRSTVLARNARDADAAKAGMGVAREDLIRAREIFARDGWEGLRRAAAAGTVPAVLLTAGVFGGEGRSAD